MDYKFKQVDDTFIVATIQTNKRKLHLIKSTERL